MIESDNSGVIKELIFAGAELTWQTYTRVNKATNKVQGMFVILNGENVLYRKILDVEFNTLPEVDAALRYIADKYFEKNGIPKDRIKYNLQRSRENDKH